MNMIMRLAKNRALIMLGVLIVHTPTLFAMSPLKKSLSQPVSSTLHDQISQQLITTSSSKKTDKKTKPEKEPTTAPISPKLKALQEESATRPTQHPSAPLTLRRPGMKESDVSNEPQTWWQRAQQAARSTSNQVKESKQQAREAADTTGKKIAESKLMRYEEKEMEKKQVKAQVLEEREERINELKQKLKEPLSREDKATIEKELAAERKKRSLGEKIEHAGASKKITSAQAVVGKKITKHETALKIGGGLAVAGGAAAMVGSLAVGIGGTSLARDMAAQPAERSEPSEQTGGETFEVIPFGPPSE